MEQVESREVSLDESTQEFLIDLTEDLRVKIKEGVWLGFAFGIGLGLAAIVFGFFGFVIFITIVKEAMR